MTIQVEFHGGPVDGEIRTLDRRTAPMQITRLVNEEGSIGVPYVYTLDPIAAEFEESIGGLPVRYQYAGGARVGIPA